MRRLNFLAVIVLVVAKVLCIVFSLRRVELPPVTCSLVDVFEIDGHCSRLSSFYLFNRFLFVSRRPSNPPTNCVLILWLSAFVPTRALYLRGSASSATLHHPLLAQQGIREAILLL